jgi:hypothetical protein
MNLSECSVYRCDIYSFFLRFSIERLQLLGVGAGIRAPPY